MPKPQGFESESEEDEELKDIKGKIVDAEKRLTKLMEKRNELNDLARRAREDRDILNDKKRSLVDEMRRLQGERDRLNGESREARDLRNECQRQAKALIEMKRRKRTEGGGYKGRVNELENEIKALQFKQETTQLKVAEENTIIDKIKALTKELQVAKVQFAEEAALLSEVKDIDQKIDDLFKQADEHHKLVVEKSNAAQALHDQVVPIFNELRFLDKESDGKHEAFLTARKEADELHQKAITMRDEVMNARGERTSVFKERRAIVNDQNANVKAELFNEEKLDAKADEAVKLLLSKGKIRL